MYNLCQKEKELCTLSLDVIAKNMKQQRVTEVAERMVTQNVWYGDGGVVEKR